MATHERPAITPKATAAHRAKDKQSTGRHSEEGNGRVRVGVLRYGKRARSNREAFPSLGGSQADPDRLIEEIYFMPDRPEKRGKSSQWRLKSGYKWQIRKNYLFFSTIKAGM